MGLFPYSKNLKIYGKLRGGGRGALTVEYRASVPPVTVVPPPPPRLVRFYDDRGLIGPAQVHSRLGGLRLRTTRRHSGPWNLNASALDSLRPAQLPR